MRNFLLTILTFTGFFNFIPASELSVKFVPGMGSQKKAFLNSIGAKEIKKQCKCGKNNTKIKRCACKISKVVLPAGMSKAAGIDKLKNQTFVQVVEEHRAISLPERIVKQVPKNTEVSTWYGKRIHWQEAVSVLKQRNGSQSFAETFPIVAIVDTGADLDHEDIVNKLVLGYNIIDPSKDPVDDNGHGTHCAGIVAAECNNKIGINGVGYKSYVMPFKALAADGVGYNDDIAKGIISAVNKGAKIVVLSLVDTMPDKVFEDALKYAEENNVLIVCAAGNDSVSNKHYPAAYPYAISVGAVNEEGKKSYFTNYGKNWVNITAPGTNMYSTYTDKFGNDIYEYEDGTSMAAPVVAGSLAMVWSTRPNMTAKELKEHLYNSARKNTDSMVWSEHGEMDLLYALWSVIGRHVKEVKAANFDSKKIYKSHRLPMGSQQVESDFTFSNIPSSTKELSVEIAGICNSPVLNTNIYLWNIHDKKYDYVGGNTVHKTDKYAKIDISNTLTSNIDNYMSNGEVKAKVTFTNTRSILNRKVSAFALKLSNVKVVSRHND